jgi:hypothetical protein
MRRLTTFAGALALIGLLAPDALSQQQRRPQQRRPQQQQQQPQRGQGFGGFSRDLTSLLAQKSVQTELKLSDDQVKKVTQLAESRGATARPQRGQTTNREELRKQQEERAQASEKALAEILKPEQLKRAKQISWQQQGTQAFANAEVATALQLSNEQKEKIRGIQEQAQQARGQLFQRGAGGNFEEARKKMEEARKATDEKVMNVLSAEQKTKWKELTGEPFKGEIQRGTRPARPPR